MSLPKYRIIINGKYLQGYDETNVMGKAGHMGWQPRAMELSAIVYTKDKNKAKTFEGNIDLKSQLDRIYDRLRYADLELQKLEIERLSDESTAYGDDCINGRCEG